MSERSFAASADNGAHERKISVIWDDSGYNNGQSGYATAEIEVQVCNE